MKTNKSLLLFALIICTSNIAFVPKAQAEEVTKTKIESNLNKDYPYTVTDSLKNLDKAKSSIEKLANSKRWSSVPENLLMVYLWNKDTYHDDIVLKLADEWIRLAKNVNDPDYVEDAKLSVVIANMIKQNFADADKAAKLLKTKNYDKDSVFIAKLVKTLLGEEKQGQTTLPGNKGYSFTYTIRVINPAVAKDLVEYKPNSDVAHYLYFTVLQKVEEESLSNTANKEPDYKEAMDELDKAIQFSPNNQLYRLKKALLTYSLSNVDSSDQSLEQVYKNSYNDSYVAEGIANFYAKGNQIDKSIYFLNKALHDDQSRISLYKKLTSLYAYQGQSQPIIEKYESAIKRYPNRVDFYNDLAELYVKNKVDYNKINDLFIRAVEANPTNSQLHVSLGDSYYYSKAFDKANDEYLSAITLDKNNTDAYGKLLSLYWDKADYAKVTQYASESIKNNNNFPTAYLWLGSVYLKQNKTQEAINVIKKSVTLRPDFIIGYNSLGLAYRADKKYDLAIQQFMKAVELNPNYEEAMFNIGDTYMQKKSYSDAEKAYNIILKGDPYNDAVYFALGNLFTESKEFDKSIKNFEKAILLNPKSLDYRNNLGNSYLKQNKLGNAVEEFENILRINPKYATAYYNIACVYSLKKDNNYSLKFLEQAINLDSSLKSVAKNDPDLTSLKDDNRFKELVE